MLDDSLVLSGHSDSGQAGQINELEIWVVGREDVQQNLVSARETDEETKLKVSSQELTSHSLYLHNLFLSAK